MLNYVNSLFCAYNPIERNLVIKMRQEEPADPSVPDHPVSINDVTSVVISRELALRLAENINELLMNDEA